MGMIGIHWTMTVMLTTITALISTKAIRSLCTENSIGLTYCLLSSSSSGSFTTNFSKEKRERTKGSQMSMPSTA